MKKKTAKQMFEDLGYSVLADNEYAISYENGEKQNVVTFWYEDLIIEYMPSFAAKIDIPLLQAINQQCKELEWI